MTKTVTINTKKGAVTFKSKKGTHGSSGAATKVKKSPAPAKRGRGTYKAK